MIGEVRDGLDAPESADGTLILGEVHTALLQNSVSLPQSRCEPLLALFRGERVRRYERPIAHAVSPDLLTGVDCRLPTPTGAKVRGAGTVACHAAITGGHVLQGSAVVRVTRAEAGHRLPWSHYLGRPGRLELLGKAVDTDDLADAFVAAPAPSLAPDLGAISGRLLDAVQTAPGLDRAPPFRAARTKLRWAATVCPAAPADPLCFTIEHDQLRTVRLTCSAEQAAGIVGFCEDLALHDWLLSTLVHLIEHSRIGRQPGPRAVPALRPAVDHLLHLWMPGARVDGSVAALWQSLERRPGLTRQWRACVDRIRDQLALSTITLLASLDERVG